MPLVHQLPLPALLLPVQELLFLLLLLLWLPEFFPQLFPEPQLLLSLPLLW